MSVEEEMVHREAPVAVDSTAAEQNRGTADESKREETGKLKALPILVVAALLILPYAYLALHRSRTPTPSGAVATSAPNSVDVLEQLVHTQPTAANRLNLSLAYIQANRASAAVPLLQRLVGEDAGNAKAWNNLCVAHNMLSQYNYALEACGHALTVEPGFQLAQNNLRWTESQRQKASDAIAAVENTPQALRTPDAYLTEGLNHLHLGNYDRALEIWQALAVREPGNASAANDIGVALMMKHQPAAAMPWFTKATTLDPSMEIARNNIAWAQSEMSMSPAK